MRLFNACVALLSVIAICSNYQKAKNVLVADDNNFEEVLKGFNAILIHFYTPWCGVCKKLAPEYSKAASVLAKENITLGQIDSSVNKNVTKSYDVQKFPTLKLFINGDAVNYTGEYTEKDFVKFMRKKAGPLIRTMTSIDQIEEFKKDHSVVMIYFRNSTEDLNIIEAIAKENDYYTFALCAIEDISNHYNVTSDAPLVMFKHFDEKRHDFKTEKITKENLLEFISNYIFPKAVYFNQYSAQLIFGNNKPGLFLYRTKHDDKREIYENLVSEIADKLNRELQVIVTGLSEDYESRLAFLFGITAEDLPAVYIHDTRNRTKTYKMKGDINEDNIMAFIDEWRRDALVAIWKSEDVPSEQGLVYQVVGKTYEKVVLKSKRDVVILFLSPYDEKVKELWMSYREIAMKNKDNKELLVSFIHCTHNDIESLEVVKVPAIYLWQAEQKELLLYEGDFTMRSIEMFLKENSTYPFEIKEEVKEEPKTEEKKGNIGEEQQPTQKIEEEANNTIKEDL